MVECTHMKHYTPLGCVIIGLIDMVRFTPALVRFTPALVRFTPWSVLPHPSTIFYFLNSVKDFNINKEVLLFHLFLVFRIRFIEFYRINPRLNPR